MNINNNYKIKILKFYYSNNKYKLKISLLKNYNKMLKIL